MAETVLTLMLMSIVSLPIVHFLAEAVSSYSYAFERIRTTEDARYTLMRIKQELLYLNTADIIQTTPTRLDYVDQSSQQTSLNLVGTDLYRGPNLLAKDVQTLAFAYYDQNGSATSTPSAVRRIAVQVDLKGDSSAVTPISYRVDIFPRNFMYQGFQ